MHGRRRPETHAWIEVIHAFARCPRRHVRHAGFHADAIAHLQVLHFVTDLDHGTGGFVTEHHRFIDDEWPDAAMLIIVNIAAANAHRVDANAHIARTDDLRQGKRAQADTACFFENQCFHD